ncbi:hypothetical protein QLQ15_13295 [Lysobacter sp. LF1]|uniref:Uncharacterized protein n=1 Tax=Lysobacter stagni TaxID=3045172 RepID=A0ABT6XIK1_9GAMM|nr:hypothetical protein [Lysobacter sp. LF1]MDI9239881.1 hypothetical protein [Lysobacter sp. LF1]
MQKSIQVTGVPWFEASDYESFKPLLPDRYWHATFAEWEVAAVKTVKQFENQGLRVVKVSTTSAEFLAWCFASGRAIDTQSLIAFATEAAFMEAHGYHR